MGYGTPMNMTRLYTQDGLFLSSKYYGTLLILLNEVLGDALLLCLFEIS